MLHVFENWASDEIKTAHDLAKQTGAEELLIGTPSKISFVMNKTSMSSFFTLEAPDLSVIANRSSNHESPCGHSLLRRESREHAWAQYHFTGAD